MNRSRLAVPVFASALLAACGAGGTNRALPVISATPAPAAPTSATHEAFSDTTLPSVAYTYDLATGERSDAYGERKRTETAGREDVCFRSCC